MNNEVTKSKYYSLQFKIIALFSILVFFLFIIVSLVFYKGIDDTIRKSTEKEYRIITDETANKIERFLYERYGDIQVLADNSILQSKNIKIQDKTAYLDKVRSAYKTYDYILVLDKDTKVIIQSGTYPKGFDFTEIFQETVAQKVYVSDINHKQHTEGIFFSASIYDESGDLYGIVLERMNLNSIEDIKKHVKMAKNGNAFLMNNKNHFIFNNDRSDQFVVNTHLESGIQYLNDHGNGFIYIFKQLKRYPTQKENWYFVLKYGEREAFTILHQIWYYTLTVIIISIFTVMLLGYLISYFITMPIKRLVKETEMLARGESLQKIKYESKDEIGSLAASLNSIILNLNMMMDQILETSGQVASIREIKDYFNRLTDEVSTGIITANASGIIISVNTAGSEILNLNQNQILGLDIKHNSTSQIKLLLDLLDKGFSENRVYAKELINYTDQTGNIKKLMVSTSFQKDKKGRVLGLICIFRKMDEFVKFEESINRTKTLNALGMMSAGIAHEIRNPLTSIKGYAQYVKSGLDKDNELQNDLNVIVFEVDRLNNLISRFLDFARPKAPVLRECNICKLIQESVNLVNKNNNTEILINHNHDLGILIKIDEEQIEQVLINLLINAVQSCDSERIVRINTIIADHKFIIEIEDKGSGVSPEDVEHLFEPFFTRKEKGTGLGLAISARIIQEHFGSIEYQPAIGKGSIFMIKLPMI